MYINDMKVSETSRKHFKWPNFEVDIGEMFQVHVFTMPSSIKIEIVFVDGLRTIEVDMIEIEVPGQHVRTLTCACQLVQQLPFSKLKYDRSLNPVKEAKEPDLSTLTDDQKKKLAEQKAKEEERERKLEFEDIKGEVFVKAEWKNYGPHMPPIKSENLFKKPKSAKNRIDEKQHQKDTFLM